MTILLEKLIQYLVFKLFTSYSTERVYELLSKLNIQYGINTVEYVEPVTVSQEVVSVPVPQEVFVRMDSDTYDYLERQVSNNLVVSNTSDLEAGFKLGIAHILQKLRSGYVIPRS